MTIIASLKDFVQSNSANYIPYSASGVELPNSNFKIDTSGQAYKLGSVSGTMPLEFGEVMAGFPDGALTELENGVTYTLTIQGAPDNSMVMFVNLNTQSPYAERPTITNNQCTFTWTHEDASVGILDYYGKINSTSTTLTYTNTTEKRYVLEDELSSGYLQTSGLEYNAVNEISAINGSALAGGAITSYTTAYSHDIPPYGGEVIDSLNGKYLSAYVSRSAENAGAAHIANTATYAQTVDETKLENDGFVKNLTSEYGTISVVRNTIESTNSAIARTGNEGFVSSFNYMVSIGPSYTATYSWDKSLPNTEITLDMDWANGYTLTYSANTELTGEIILPVGTSTQTIAIPNATEFKAWANDWVSIVSAVASAADSFETVVGELAWASALPTYQYDEQDRISAINNSAVAGGTDIEFGYDSADNISAINNSAISQTPSQKLYLQSPLTTGVSGTSAYIGVLSADLARMLGVDETVLFSGNATYTNFPLTLNEPMSSFDTIKFYWQPFNYPAKNWTVSEKIPVGADDYYTLFDGIYNTGTKSWFDVAFAFKEENGKLNYISGAFTNWVSTTPGDASTFLGMFKIVGIGRKN